VGVGRQHVGQMGWSAAIRTAATARKNNAVTSPRRLGRNEAGNESDEREGTFFRLASLVEARKDVSGSISLA
jgi:hypothetical protein